MKNVSRNTIILIVAIILILLGIIITTIILLKRAVAKKQLEDKANEEIQKTIRQSKTTGSPAAAPAKPINITVQQPPAQSGQPSKHLVQPFIAELPSKNGQTLKQEVIPGTGSTGMPPVPMLQNTTLNTMPASPPEAILQTETIPLPAEIGSGVYVTSKMVRIYSKPDMQSPILDEKNPVANGRLLVGQCTDVIFKESQPRWFKIKPINMDGGIKDGYVREDFVELFHIN